MLTLKWFMGDREDLKDIRSIRKQVFVEELGLSPELEDDGQDGSCLHLVAYESGLPISTGRVMITNEDFILSRIATIKEHRNQGIATGIIEALVEACVQMGGTRQVLHSQVSSKAFYEKIGFKAYDVEFLCLGLPHVAMEHFGGLRKCKGCMNHEDRRGREAALCEAKSIDGKGCSG